MVERRRHMMAAWGSFVQGIEPEKVVNLREEQA
jgi:hypothetical protein